MFKSLIYTIGLCFVAITACSTARQTAQVSPAFFSDTARLQNALLWKISHPDLKHDSYLFGTIHIIDEEDYFLPGGTELAMEKADRLVFEIDMKEMMDIGAQISILTKAFMKDGMRLSDLVSAEDYALIEKHFADIGLPMMILDKIKPLFLTVFASGDVSPGDLNSGEMKSYEMEFFEFAQDNKKETGGLETTEFQLSVFDSIPYKAQAEMLVESIRAEDDQNDVFQQMIDMYRSQDIEGLYLTIGDDEMGAGDYEDILVNNRNQRWISGMGEYMKTESIFFAVGAGHLGGPQGVIRLLKKNGYVVSPVIETGGRPMQKF